MENWIDEVLSRLNKSKVITASGCWLYKGRSKRQWIGINYKTYLVHRISASIYMKYDLNDTKNLICHKQECPNPGCFNPEHLYIGDHRSNKLDEIAPGKYRNGNTNKVVCSVCGGRYTAYKHGNKVWRKCKKCLSQNRRAHG